MEILVWGSIIAYSFMLLFLYIGWQKIPLPASNLPPPPTTPLSVVIAMRNEAKHIAHLLEDLNQQSHSFFEVWIVDDNSTDQSVEVIQQYQKKVKYPLFYLLAETEGKKNALQTGIKHVKNDYVVCTDADCRVEKKWLEGIAVQIQKQPEIVFWSGLVRYYYEEKPSFFAKLQALEFSSLIGVGASTLSWHVPTMCNGANMIFRKEAFWAVNGYEGNLHIASGDDEFLLHKIAQRYPSQVAVIKNMDTIVHTHPANGWQMFEQQRLRWASKWKHQKNIFSKILASFIFFINFFIFIAILLTIAKFYTLLILLAQILIKSIIEFLFLYPILKFFRRKSLMAYIPIIQLLYPLYALYFGIRTLSGNHYVWKDRPQNF
ncbi:MAG: glycosyltransferase [Cytophagales bacterium]|nr:MAG: glycosyltransferase [Cytophagales bacterium]